MNEIQKRLQRLESLIGSEILSIVSVGANGELLDVEGHPLTPEQLTVLHKRNLPLLVWDLPTERDQPPN